MSTENPQGPAQPEPAPPVPSLLPPPAEGMGLPPAWAPAPPPPPRPSVWSRLAAFAVLIAVVSAIAGAGIGWSLARVVSPHQAAQSITPESPIQAATPSTGNSSSANSIAAKVIPAVVDINTTLGSGQAAGSGMIVSPTGEILTNNHVVAGSTSISVTVPSRHQTYPAHVIGVNVAQDVAVIQIDASVSGLPTVTMANSSSVHVGDTVLAIGNALGQGGAPRVTEGHVTALDQTITASTGGANAETLNGMIQSDALIYEGDSGGALVNSAGQVIGMITAGQAQGFRSAASDVGYAISANTALAILNRIRALEPASDLTYGQVGFLGVSVQSLDAQAAAQLGLNVTSGALVTATPQSGTPAGDAGIPRYSVITRVGDTAVTSADSLGAAIKSHRPGESVSVTWVSSSGTHSATITLAGVNP